MREPFQGGWYTCPVCRRRFRISGAKDDWTFAKMIKGKKVYYCSWKCVRLMEKEIELRKEAENVRHGQGAGKSPGRPEGTV